MELLRFYWKKSNQTQEMLYEIKLLSEHFVGQIPLCARQLHANVSNFHAPNLGVPSEFFSEFPRKQTFCTAVVHFKVCTLLTATAALVILLVPVSKIAPI